MNNPGFLLISKVVDNERGRTDVVRVHERLMKHCILHRKCNNSASALLNLLIEDGYQQM